MKAPEQIAEMSDIELLAIIHSKNHQNSNYDMALSEYHRRQGKKERKVYIWTIIAGISAVVAAIFAIAQYFFPIHNSNDKSSSAKTEMRSKASNNQHPNKSNSSINTYSNMFSSPSPSKKTR